MSKIKALGLPNKIKALGVEKYQNKIQEDFNITLPKISLKEETDVLIGKKNLLHFLISGSSRWGRNDLTIELINENKELVFTTSKWKKMDYGFTMKTNVIATKTGEFTIHFKVNKMLTNSLILETKYEKLEYPKLVKDVKINYTDEQKAKLITIVYGESARDENLCVNIPWIYYNLTKNHGFEKGMRRSSYYKKRKSNKWIKEAYKASMYYLGEGDQYAEDYMVNGIKIKDFCKETNEYFCKAYKYYIDLIRDYFNHNIFDVNEVNNPYYNWEGQGYWMDMNIRMHNYSIKWAKASQYFHLQKKEYVKNILVKEIIAYDHVRHIDATTYLCDDIGIKKYFEDNPKNFPKFENGKCTVGGNKVLCNQNEKNSIPGVHF